MCRNHTLHDLQALTLLVSPLLLHHPSLHIKTNFYIYQDKRQPSSYHFSSLTLTFERKRTKLTKHLHHLQHKDYVINVGIYMIICTQGIHMYFIITLLLLSLPNHYVDYITNSFSRLNILRGLFIVLS